MPRPLNEKASDQIFHFQKSKVMGISLNKSRKINATPIHRGLINPTLVMTTFIPGGFRQMPLGIFSQKLVKYSGKLPSAPLG